MGRTIFGRNSKKLALNRSIRGRKAICESLEDRTLMSLTIEVRGTDGSSSATVSAVGQVLNLELIAVITDPNNTPSQDGLQDVDGGIQSVASQGHAVAGNLTAANAGHFTASGSAPGTFQDTNGDGNIDVGSTDPTSTIGEFFARSSPLQTSINGTIVGNTLTFEIATLTYTVTNLNKGGATSINFKPFVSSTPDAAGWLEDDQAVNNDDGTYQAGTAYTVNDPALIVPPIAVDDSATVTKNTALDINELANDDIIVPLNPSSVVIVTNVAHGTTVLQTDGSVLYTPATNYLGADSFTYHVADTDGRVSNTATVNITVKLAPPPVAGAVSAGTLRNQAVSINVIPDDSTTAPATLTASSVAVAVAPANGTAVANSNGTILYTPHTGFLGTDTFTYTVADSNDETSNPGTVTVTVSLPVPPVANNDQFTTSEGAPLSLNILANDMSQSAALAPSTVTIVSAVQHGTTSVGADGSVLYTPTPAFMGTDSFTYTVADVLGDTSNVAIVSLVIGADVAPVATTSNAYALAGSTTTINISSVVTSPAPLDPSTAAVVAQPTHGTLTDAGGSFSYTANAGFVGSDSFTFNVADVNGGATATPGTVNIFVGAAVGNKGAAAKSISFIDADGGSQTVSINSGTADVYFSGSGTLATAKNGKGTISGQSNLQIAKIQLAGTSKSSTLSVNGLVSKPVTIGGISDASAMGGLSAASAILTGAINFNGGIGTIKVDAIATAQIYVNSGSTGKLALTAGGVTDTSLNSVVPITTLKVGLWTDGSAQTISAPSITSLSVSGAFDPSLTLTGKGVDISSAKIGGAASNFWTINGSAGSISLGSAINNWEPTITGNLNSLAIKTGGLNSETTAGTIGTITIGGDLTGAITTASAKSIKVTGALSGAVLNFSGAAGLKTLTVGGAVSNETIKSAGSIGTITVGSISGSNVSAGVNSTVTVANATASTLGTSVISSFKVTSKASGAFADTDILASRIASASLGNITTGNNGTGFGLATKSISSFAATFANGPVHLGAAQLKSETILQLYVSQQAIIFSDFSLAIES